MPTKTIKLYYHKTDGGAEYFCSSKVKGTESEGSFDSKYIIRTYGKIKTPPKYTEMIINS